MNITSEQSNKQSKQSDSDGHIVYNVHDTDKT